MKDENPSDTVENLDTANCNVANATELVQNDNGNKEVSQNNKQKNKNEKAVVDDATTEDTVSIASDVKINNEGKLETLGSNEFNVELTDVTHNLRSKYKYTDNQWSPSNPTGKKAYDIDFLMQLKDDPLSTKAPKESDLLEVVMRSEGSDRHFSLPKPSIESFLPSFVNIKSPGSMRGLPRDPKKRVLKSKSNMERSPGMGSPNTSRGVISINLGNREKVELNETENAWRPERTKKVDITDEEQKTEDLYKKFRGILNKLTPQKFAKLLDQVKSLEINTEERLNGVIDLVFEKAIEEPNFSEAYASMCVKLSTIQVPTGKSDQQFVNFRVLLINKCQKQFLTTKVSDEVAKLEKDISECTDAATKKDLQLQLDEENRKVRMRSVGNVRFIGELYKLKMLNAKIMGYCLTSLVSQIEEEKLECLCKLLTTIGQQVDNEAKEQVDGIFKKMQEIVDKKSRKISSRVRFMLQDTIALRRRGWASKNIIDSQPKTLDEIQKEADQKQRNIEIMNANIGGSNRRDDGGSNRRDDGGSNRRDDGGRGKRGDNRRSAGGGLIKSNFDNNSWQVTSRNKSIDTSKLKAVGNDSNIKNLSLRPPSSSGWNLGSGARTGLATANIPLAPTTTMNKFSVLEIAASDPATTIDNKETPSKGASKEKASPNTRSGNGAGSISEETTSAATGSASDSSKATIDIPPAAEPASTEPAMPLTDSEKRQFKAMIEEASIHLPNNEELASEIKSRFKPAQHAQCISEIFNIAWELKPTTYAAISKTLVHLVSSKTISSEDFVSGISEHFEFAPDLHIDIPKLYDYLAKFVVPHVIAKYVTLERLLDLSHKIISEGHGALFLKPLLLELKSEMGPTYVKSEWQKSGMRLNQWMNEDKVEAFQKDQLDFLVNESAMPTTKEAILSHDEIYDKLLGLMYKEQSLDCIKGWIKDHVGESISEDWFIRILIQVICEYALFGNNGKSAPRFDPNRMSKYFSLISESGLDKQFVESNCLFGVQSLLHRLEHPLGVTLEIFQYLSETYISTDGFLAWEKSEVVPEGKAKYFGREIVPCSVNELLLLVQHCRQSIGLDHDFVMCSMNTVMLMALTSFFTNIKEAENEDSGSEE